MIRDLHIPEANKRILLDFQRYLQETCEEEALVDAQMGDVTLYVMDYTSDCLNGSSLSTVNAFDVYCFMADYVIRQVPNCTSDILLRMSNSLSSLVAYMAQVGIIDSVDLYEILALCDDPNPFLLRCEQYHQLVKAQDVLGLQRWRENVLDSFGT